MFSGRFFREILRGIRESFGGVAQSFSVEKIWGEEMGKIQICQSKKWGDWQDCNWHRDDATGVQFNLVILRFLHPNHSFLCIFEICNTLYLNCIFSFRHISYCPEEIIT